MPGPCLVADVHDTAGWCPQPTWHGHRSTRAARQEGSQRLGETWMQDLCHVCLCKQRCCCLKPDALGNLVRNCLQGSAMDWLGGCPVIPAGMVSPRSCSAAQGKEAVGASCWQRARQPPLLAFWPSARPRCWASCRSLASRPGG